MASSTDICNRSLALLGQEPILTLDATSKESRACKQWYDVTRDSLLRSYPWTFAITRAVLARLQEPPVFGYKYQYALPVDCLRLVDTNITDEDFRVEQNRVLTDLDHVEIRYVQQVLDPSKMDSQFIEALVLKLALDMSFVLTADLNLMQTIAARLQEVTAVARGTQAVEDAPARVIEGEWIPSRR